MLISAIEKDGGFHFRIFIEVHAPLALRKDHFDVGDVGLNRVAVSKVDDGDPALGAERGFGGGKREKEGSKECEDAQKLWCALQG
jgi:hypothetical protein